jgi:hypothetical protein
VVVVCVLCSAARGQYGEGTGAPDAPYLIHTAAEMNAIGSNPNDWDKHFKLEANIDLSAYTGSSFNVIGSHWENGFSGVFDGSGHTIFNFTYNSTDMDYVGLFRFVSGEIRNLGLIDPNIDAGTGRNVGSLVGWLGGGIVSTCYVEGGRVSGHEGIGGLVGSMTFGGLISDCYATGSVSGYRDIGGTLGSNDSGTVTNCHSTASVFGSDRVGGLVGSNGMMTNAAISTCYYGASVVGNAQVGGIAGVNGDYGVILNSYTTGSAEGTGMVGGLAGLNGGEIDKCYSASSVVGDGNVGGLVGYSYLGGVRGSFWDMQTSGQGNSEGGTGLTTAEMKDPNTFISAGWDFLGESDNGNYEIWRLCDKGTKYAALSWQFPLGDITCPDVVDSSDLLVLCNNWLSEGLSTDVWPEGGDGLVNFLDWAILADAWQITKDHETIVEFAGQWLKREGMIADIAPDDGDGIVNMVDFAVLADNWLGGVVLLVDLVIDEFWMYQNLPEQSNSDLTASASVTDDPLGNSSYSYAWEILLPGDVSLAPVTVAGGGAGDAYWTFAARGCDEPGGLSDSGQTFTVRVTVTGDDYGNTGQAEADFGIALLGDTNNDGVVNVADRSIANAFWRTGSAGAYTLRDCDLNCDGVVNVADRSIANTIWRGILGQNSVSTPCPLR